MFTGVLEQERKQAFKSNELYKFYEKIIAMDRKVMASNKKYLTIKDLRPLFNCCDGTINLILCTSGLLSRSKPILLERAKLNALINNLPKRYRKYLAV